MTTLAQKHRDLMASLADPLLTTTEVAEVLGVCYKTVDRWCLSGKLRHYALPSGCEARRVPLSAVFEMARQLPPEAI